MMDVVQYMRQNGTNFWGTTVHPDYAPNRAQGKADAFIQKQTKPTHQTAKISQIVEDKRTSK